jgi:hypothetical protein
LGPIRNDLLKPDRVAPMAKEMQDYFADRMRSMQAQVVELPREIKNSQPASLVCASA